MPASVEESKIIGRFVPSLHLITSVRIGVLLFNTFNCKTLKNAFKEILYGNSTAGLRKISESIEEIEDNEMTRARDRLLFIPPHLRMGVYEAVIGFQISYTSFVFGHPDIPIHDCVVLLKCEGTIDIIETVQYLIMNKNISIRKRFEVACCYCLEKSIRVLWSEMEVSGEANNFNVADHSMVSFWSNRMRFGSQVPWTQAVLDHLESYMYLMTIPRFSSFFPLMQPKDRQKCLRYLPDMEIDDLRYCLYSMTKEEQEKAMKIDTFRILYLLLQWPMQSLFLKTAEKMWKFIDVETFGKILEYLISHLTDEGLFDYRQILKKFSLQSPNHFRDTIMKSKILIEKVYSFLVR